MAQAIEKEIRARLLAVPGDQPAEADEKSEATDE